MTETAHARLARLLNMGKYGEQLAYEILDQHIEDWLASEEDLEPWKQMRNE